MEENTFLAGLRQEGKIEPTDGEQEEEKETPSESPAEKEPEENEPESQTGDKPEDKGDGKESKGEVEEGEKPEVFQAFHKHPRWKALNEELGKLRSFRDEVTPLLPLIKKIGEPGMTDEVEVPAWFSQVFGEDASVWQKYQKYNAEERGKLKDEILESLESKNEESGKQQKKYEDWVDGELVALGEEKGINLSEGTKEKPNSLRNEILKTAVDYRPTDDKGNISLSKAYDILKIMKNKPAEKNTDKKEIADKTMAKSKAEDEKKEYKTSHDLIGKSMRDLIPE